MLSTLLKAHFPSEHVKYALGYGSAVFKQANYEQTNAEQIIDMILIVDDTAQFHEKNMKQNYAHYSYFAKRLPPTITNNLVQNAGSNLYFNPLIPLKSFGGDHSSDERRIKYGVIG
jgi:hypothetical protein